MKPANSKSLCGIPSSNLLFKQYGVLLLIIVLGAAIRSRYFIGFGLGDDMGYVNLADLILRGLPLDYHYLNVYAFRPLLLLCIAASFKLFGVNDVSFILPVFLSAMGGIVVVYALGRFMYGHRVGAGAAFFLAIFPSNVYNSVTFVNDTIISLFTAVSVLFFFKAREKEFDVQTSWYALAGFTLVVAYLFKITSLMFLGVFGIFSFFELVFQRKNLNQIAFYGAFAVFFFLTLCFYKLQTGEFFRHFYAERFYFNTNIPDDYLSGAYDVANMLMQYPRHFFLPMILGEQKFFEFGFYFYLLFPSSLAFILKSNNKSAAFFLCSWVVLLFCFLEFMPSNLDPFYLPIPRQERYLEIITLPVMIILGWAFAWLWRKKKWAALALAFFLTLSSLNDIHIRCTEARNSISDLKAASHWLCEKGAKRVYIDGAGMPYISFHTHSCKIDVLNLNEAYKHLPPDGAFILSGGSRMFLWDPAVIQVVDPERIHGKLEKVMEYEESDAVKKKGPLTIYRCQSGPE
jgi:hypothetical protein